MDLGAAYIAFYLVAVIPAALWGLNRASKIPPAETFED